MNDNDDLNDDAFLESLAGRSSADPRGVALRSAALDRQRVIDDAEAAARVSPAPGSDEARERDEMRARLAGLGAFVSRARAPAAANEAWFEERLQLLAAASGEDANVPVMLASPPTSVLRWTLTRAPVVGEDSVYLIFEAHADDAAALAGCRVRLRLGDQVLDLGNVSAEGMAQCKVMQGVDLRREAVLSVARPA